MKRQLHARAAPPIYTDRKAASVDDLDHQWRIVAVRERLDHDESWLWLVDAGAFIRGRDADLYVSVTGRDLDGRLVTYGKVAG